MNSHLYSFVASDVGRWAITRLDAVIGEALPVAHWLDVVHGDVQVDAQSAVAAERTNISWVLRGVISYERYVRKSEQMALTAISNTLDRPQATCAALIPIKKSAAWWALPQDERRAILEEQSHHIQIGLQYTPAVARRLHHGHDLGEPFDFLTWFEFAPKDADAFEVLVQTLRATEEWQYVEREVDIRLTRG